jgi:hypothetical protein
MTRSDGECGFQYQYQGDNEIERTNQQVRIVGTIEECRIAVGSETGGCSPLAPEGRITADASQMGDARHQWEGGIRHGGMPLLNADQMVERKEGTKQGQG